MLLMCLMFSFGSGLSLVDLPAPYYNELYHDSEAQLGDRTSSEDDLSAYFRERGPIAGRLSSNKFITLLGERESGTNWIAGHLHDCFPQLAVSLAVSDWKHFFQWEERARPEALERSEATVIIMRKPLEWVMGMRHRPWHAPAHRGLTWNEFVKKPWTMDVPSVSPTCTDKEPCRGCIHRGPHSSRCPHYELHPGGSRTPYEGILGMRADKLINFANVSTWMKPVGKTVGVWYEDLLENGTEQLILTLSRLMGKEHHCVPQPAQPDKKKHYQPYPEGYEEWVREHVHSQSELIFDTFSKATLTGDASAVRQWALLSPHLELSHP